MAGSGVALTRANAAIASSNTAQNTANQPKASTIFATAFGVVGDGVTANDTAIANAIAAATASGSTYANAQFAEVVLPAGQIRITKPIVVTGTLTTVGFTLRGAGRRGTIILADFSTSNPAPYFTVTGGGGSGAVLYPIIDYGALVAVRVINGGTGYTSAPTVTLVTAAGSGATVTATVSGGAITSVAVNTGGSGLSTNYDGDAIVIRGQQARVADLSIISSTARAAASNGGTSAYPFFTTNNGVRYEPVGAATQTMQHNALERVNVSGQPGHGINAARVEQWVLDQVAVSTNGADGLLLHTQGGNAGSWGISNTLRQLRSLSNAYRGLHVEGMNTSTVLDSVVGTNLTAGTQPSGVNEEIWLSNCQGWEFRIDVERNDGAAAGRSLIRLSGCYGIKVGGFFRGGLCGVYLNTALACSFDGITHSGNASDPTSYVLEIDSGSNSALYAPFVGNIYIGTNVANQLYTSNAFPINGLQNGTLNFSGLRGSQYAASVSSSYTPNPISGGAFQTLTLTGNATIANPTSNLPGQILRLILVQDTTGSRAVSFGTAYVGTNVGSLGSGTATKIGIIDFQCVVSGGRTAWVQTFWSGWL
jgi:hypothetical protein